MGYKSMFSPPSISNGDVQGSNLPPSPPPPHPTLPPNPIVTIEL